MMKDKSISPLSGRLLTVQIANLADKTAPASSLSGTVSADNLHRLPMFVVVKQVSGDIDLAYPTALYPDSEPSDGNMKPVRVLLCGIHDLDIGWIVFLTFTMSVKTFVTREYTLESTSFNPKSQPQLYAHGPRRSPSSTNTR